MDQKRLLLLCERGGFAPLHQAAFASAAMLATGGRVDLVLFHAALVRYLDGSVDEADTAEQRTALEEGRVRPVSEVLEGARAGGLRVFACSASVALSGREPARTLEQVDEVVGWPTILSWMSASDHVLYL